MHDGGDGQRRPALHQQPAADLQCPEPPTRPTQPVAGLQPTPISAAPPLALANSIALSRLAAAAAAVRLQVADVV